MRVSNSGRKLYDLWFYKCEWKIWKTHAHNNVEMLSITLLKEVNGNILINESKEFRKKAIWSLIL